MTTSTIIDQLYLQEVLANERPRLLGLCAYLTGDGESGEDVVQEVMLEAWRSYANLRNPEALDAWLNGIVRNVCARWRRTRRRESSVRLYDQARQAKTNPDAVLATLTDPFDIEVELDRQELAVLLDRALALLPENTRDLLVRKYIAEAGHAEIADQLGLSENAVAVRLQRGKIALRKLLTTELRSEAAAFGLVTSADSWTATRLWCPLCGQRHMLGKLTETEFALRCPTCSVEPGAYITRENWAGHEPSFGQLKSFRPILKQQSSYAFSRWVIALQQGEHRCPFCNASSLLYRYLPEGAPASIRSFRGMYGACERCHCESSITLYGLAICSPEGLAFFQAYPRMHLLPECEIEFQGVPAVVQSFASVPDAATFEVIMHRDTYMILASYRSDDR